LCNNHNVCGGPVWKSANGGQLPQSNLAISESYMAITPRRLQTWLSAEHFTTPANNTNVTELENSGQIQTSLQTGQQATSNQNGHPQQPYCMGTIAEQGEPAECENDVITQEYNAQMALKSHPHGDMIQIEQDHYYRQNTRNSKIDPSPSRSASSSASPNRCDRPKSLPLRTAATITDLRGSNSKQGRHQETNVWLTSSTCDDLVGEQRTTNGNVRRQQSVPPIASVDSIHETDL